MHTLGREIRFSINPFTHSQMQGFNSYASKPMGADGLGLFLSLRVELTSNLNRDTGFVVNVTEIDRAVRKTAVPLMSDGIGRCYRQGNLPTLQRIGGLLQECWSVLEPEFTSQHLASLTLALNPYRSISIQSEDCMNMYYSEKFEFSAMHQLWNDAFDDAQNYEMFGKCANPAGHGHNYILEVKVTRPMRSDADPWLADYQKVIHDNFIEMVDHKNLNIEVPGFENQNPTVENLARFAWEILVEKFSRCTLSAITIWENDRTYCSFSK